MVITPYKLLAWDFKEHTWNLVKGVVKPIEVWKSLGGDTWGYRIIDTKHENIVLQDITGIPELEKKDPLASMTDYSFERSVFVTAIKDVYLDFEDDIYTIHHFQGAEFVLFRIEDEFYILHRDSGTMINWYKNLGRANTCNKDMSVDDLRRFILMFKDAIKYELDNTK